MPATNSGRTVPLFRRLSFGQSYGTLGLFERIGRMLRIFILLAVLLCPPALARAGSALSWDRKQVELHPAVGDKEARAEYPFTNTGPQTVVIDSVRSSCGCTTVGLEKKEYAPGEKGRITVVFNLGQRRGLQAKGIQVKVRGESESAILTMIVRIPEVLKIDPPLVVWTVNEPLTAKSIRLTLASGTGVRLGKVTSNAPAIDAALQTVKEGSEDRLVVKPAGLDKPVFAVLSIEMLLPAKVRQTFQAYAQVRAAAKPTSK